MKKKRLLIGGAISATVAGIATGIVIKFSHLNHLPSNEIKFNPYTSTSAHPFYIKWATVDRSVENFNKLISAFRRFGRINIQPRPLSEMPKRDRLIVNMASLDDFIDMIMRRCPEEFPKFTEIPLDVEVDPKTRECILSNPYDSRDPRTLTPSEAIEKIKIRRTIIKNRKNLRATKKELVSDLMHDFLYAQETAEAAARLIRRDNFSVGDLTDRELERMWNAVCNTLNEFITEKSSLLTKACRLYMIGL